MLNMDEVKLLLQLKKTTLTSIMNHKLIIIYHARTKKRTLQAEPAAYVSATALAAHVFIIPFFSRSSTGTGCGDDDDDVDDVKMIKL